MSLGVNPRRGQSLSADEGVLWSVRWHGYRRTFGPDGVLTHEEGQEVELQVLVAGNWIVCDCGGCVIVESDDPTRFEHLALCLLGKAPDPMKPRG